MFDFLQISIVDVLDILIVSLIFYEFYLLIRKTVAEKVFITIILLYLFGVLVKLLNFKLLGEIMQQILGVGIISVLIVFQGEIRRFILITATRFSDKFKDVKFPLFKQKTKNKIPIEPILDACEYFQKNSIGSLIVVSDKRLLDSYYEKGQRINADVNAALLKTIFFKNTPLHDGGVVIVQDKIVAAACVFPLTERIDLPYYLGLRHRAAIGISEEIDALVIVVSEERGQISIAEYGKIYLGIDIPTLRNKLNRKFYGINQKIL